MRHVDHHRALASAHKHRQHPRISIQMMPRDLAAGEEAGQGHVAQRVADDLQLGVGGAEVRAAAAGAADIDAAADAARGGWG